MQTPLNPGVMTTSQTYTALPVQECSRPSASNPSSGWRDKEDMVTDPGHALDSSSLANHASALEELPSPIPTPCPALCPGMMLLQGAAPSLGVITVAPAQGW